MSKKPRRAERSIHVRVPMTTAERAKLLGIARTQGLTMAGVMRALLKGVDDAGKRLEVL